MNLSSHIEIVRLISSSSNGKDTKEEVLEKFKWNLKTIHRKKEHLIEYMCGGIMDITYIIYEWLIRFLREENQLENLLIRTMMNHLTCNDKKVLMVMECDHFIGFSFWEYSQKGNGITMNKFNKVTITENRATLHQRMQCLRELKKWVLLQRNGFIESVKKKQIIECIECRMLQESEAMSIKTQQQISREINWTGQGYLLD